MADIPPCKKTGLRKRAWEVDREFRAVAGCSGKMTGITDKLTGILGKFSLSVGRFGQVE